MGICVISGVIWFGYILTKSSRLDKRFLDISLDGIFRHWFEKWHKYYDDIPHYLHDSYVEHLQRRNEFWTAYGQILIAVLIVVILAVLLLTNTISAEAGLPILSGISGFAIAKGVSGSKSTSAPKERRPQG